MKIITKYKHIWIALLAAILIKTVVPPANGLTGIGVNVLAVLVPVLYLWLTVGTDWVSLFALAGIIMTGVMPAAAVYGASMGSATIIVVITCMGLNKVLSDTGVIKKIAGWFLTRNIVRNRPYAFMAMFFLAATPICHAVPLIMIGTAAASGITITYTQWMTLGMPFAFLMYLLLLLVICVIWKPEASKYHNYDLDGARAKKVPLTREGIISLIVFAGVVLAWIVPEIFPALLPAAAKTALSAWGNTVPAIVGVCLLCVIRVDDKPIASFAALAKAAPMTLLIFIGAVVVFGSAVSSADTGISAALSNLLAPLTGTLSIGVIVGLGVLFCLILTNFVSNVVSMLLFFGLVLPVAAAASVSTAAIAIIICLVANFASLVPSAAVTAPLFFGPGHITVRNTLKWNLLMIGACFVICMLVLYPLGNAVL